jgi:diadenosine hexaphosphate hydrolase (ATP-forming)
MEKNQTSSGGIVVREVPGGIKVLLIKDRFGHWTWPKGHLEPGETLEEAALREIEEETGISDLEIINKAGIQKYLFKDGENEIHKSVHIFLVRSEGDETIKVQTEEISEAEWFLPDTALEKIEYEGSTEILKEVLKNLDAKYP